MNDIDIDLLLGLNYEKSIFKCTEWPQILLSLIIRSKLPKIKSAPNDLKMTLDATRPKVSHICWNTTRKSQISLRFALQSRVFQIIEVFDLPIGYNG